MQRRLGCGQRQDLSVTVRNRYRLQRIRRSRRRMPPRSCIRRRRPYRESHTAFQGRKAALSQCKQAELLERHARTGAEAIPLTAYIFFPGGNF